MKFLAILTLVVILAACGKDNESGKPSLPKSSVSPLTMEEESRVREDFLEEGDRLLRVYGPVMRSMFGFRTVGLIRNRLKYENVDISQRLLLNGRNKYTRSFNRNSTVILYVGDERPSLSWGQYLKRRNMDYTRLVMHELLLLGEVDDSNFQYTDQILIPARR